MLSRTFNMYLGAAGSPKCLLLYVVRVVSGCLLSSITLNAGIHRGTSPFPLCGNLRHIGGLPSGGLLSVMQLA